MEIQIIMTFCNLIQHMEQLYTEVLTAAVYDKEFAQVVVNETTNDSNNWEALSEEAQSWGNDYDGY